MREKCPDFGVKNVLIIFMYEFCVGESTFNDVPFLKKPSLESSWLTLSAPLVTYLIQHNLEYVARGHMAFDQ